MKKINFKEFPMKKGLSSNDNTIIDIREEFANIIYNNVNGIAALTLAQKIYKSDGELEIDDDEESIIVNVVDQFCIGRLIDSLHSVLNLNLNQ